MKKDTHPVAPPTHTLWFYLHLSLPVFGGGVMGGSSDPKNAKTATLCWLSHAARQLLGGLPVKSKSPGAEFCKDNSSQTYGMSSTVSPIHLNGASSQVQDYNLNISSPCMFAEYLGTKSSYFSKAKMHVFLGGARRACSFYRSKCHWSLWNTVYKKLLMGDASGILAGNYIYIPRYSRYTEARCMPEARTSL